MKQVPERYRETTRQWHGKTGTSWCITCYVRKTKDSNGKVLSDVQVHIQILDGNEKQDALTNYALLMASMEVYCRGNENAKFGWIKSDQAGCFKCPALLVLLWSSRKSIPNFELKGYKYSTPGDGKVHIYYLVNFYS